MSTTLSADTNKKHQTPKSIATKKSILDATIQCFVEIGYHRTTTTEIAKRANVTRGAVQYYFPTTPDVLRASIEHLLETWTSEYSEALLAMPDGDEKFEFMIDTYWRFINRPFYVAWQELQAAARTDEELAAIVRDASIIDDVNRRELGHETLPELDGIAAEDFSLGRDFGRIMLEGLSTTKLTYDHAQREQAVLAMLKKVVIEFWQDAKNKKS